MNESNGSSLTQENGLASNQSESENGDSAPIPATPDGQESYERGTALKNVGLFRQAAEHYEGSLPVNLGTGEEVAIRNLATMIAAEAGFEGQIIWDTTKPNGQPRRCLDVSRAKQLFGFQAKHALREGLKKTMQWFFNNRHNLRQVTF